MSSALRAQQDYTKRAAALDRREAELRAKEAEVKKAEDELRRTGALRPEKNWPPCYPILHHDIAGEACPLTLDLNLHPVAWAGTSSLLDETCACSSVDSSSDQAGTDLRLLWVIGHAVSKGSMSCLG